MSTPNFSPIHVDELVALIESLGEALYRIDAIVKAIEAQAGADIDGLAGAAHYVADDFINIADYLAERVKKGGVLTRQGESA